jgi:hypothetical protein
VAVHLGADVPVAQQELGATCTGAADCRSGICREGVCCESDCGAACTSCRIAGAEGRCRPRAAGSCADPAPAETPSASSRRGRATEKASASPASPSTARPPAAATTAA